MRRRNRRAGIRTGYGLSAQWLRHVKDRSYQEEVPHAARAAASIRRPGQAAFPSQDSINSSRSPRIPGNCRRPRSFNRNGPDRVRAQLRARAPPKRYPDPDIVVLDKRFKSKLGNTPIQRLHTGTLWAEGPGVERRRPLSAVERHPQRRNLRWIEEDGHVSRRFRFPSGNTTATPSTIRAGRSPASTARAKSCATSTTARSRCWPTSSTARSSTPRTTRWCIPTTARSGSPIPAMAR